MLHVHAIYPYCMPLLHAFTACTRCISMLHGHIVHAAWPHCPCCISMLHVLAAFPCCMYEYATCLCMFFVNVHAVYPCCMSLLHVHVLVSCPCYMFTLHAHAIQAACPCYTSCMPMLYKLHSHAVNDACPCIVHAACRIFMSMLHDLVECPYA